MLEEPVGEAEVSSWEPDRGLIIVALAIDRIGPLNASEKLRIFYHSADVDTVAWLTSSAVRAGSSLRLGVVMKGLSRFMEGTEPERSRLTERVGGCILYVSGHYPPLLAAVYDPPFLWYYRGQHPELLASVGRRNLSLLLCRETHGSAALAAGGVPVTDSGTHGVPEAALGVGSKEGRWLSRSICLELVLRSDLAGDSPCYGGPDG